MDALPNLYDGFIFISCTHNASGQFYTSTLFIKQKSVFLNRWGAFKV